jgi:hypothetical protein
MSNRHLALAAAVVWAIAVLVGAFVAAPLWFGFDVDTGLIISGLAASGSFTAAAVAVWVATSDRRERMRERDAEDEAQAKLVIITPRRPDSPLELQINVTNHGTRAIIDITFVGLVVEGHDHLNDLRPTIGPFSVIAAPVASTQFAGPLAGSSLFTFDPATYAKWAPYYIAMRGGPNGERATITPHTWLTATVRWTDAHGKTWQRTGSGPPDASRVDVGTPVRVS